MYIEKLTLEMLNELAEEELAVLFFEPAEESLRIFHTKKADSHSFPRSYPLF